MRALTVQFLRLSVLCAVLGASSLAFARDRANLKKVVEDSNAERAGVETNYRNEGRLARGADGNLRAIHVEIGDELGAETDGTDPAPPAHLSGDHAYREKGVSKKLEREWKEVNNKMKTSKSASTTKVRKDKSGRGLSSGEEI